MPTITKIEHKSEKERYWIYVDGIFCVSVRERTFPALNLSIGQEISCDAIKERESHLWKHAYGEVGWNKEKVRLNKVKAFLESIDPRIEALIVGFGASTNQFIAGHPEEAGRPDIEVRNGTTLAILMHVEVTGTEYMRGKDYWVRPDKVAYVQNHPDQDVWIVLHYQSPVEKFIFIKPLQDKIYPVEKKIISQRTELFVLFDEGMLECRTQSEFELHLKSLI